MPRSGGTFTRTDGTRTGSTVWQQARDSGVKIVATGMDTHDQDVADALTASIANDGQTNPTANLPMATKRHTGVGDGAARTDYASAGQSQDGSLNWVDGGGTADAITATYAPAITALIDGQLCHVRATAANATTTPTFAPNGLTARTIVKEGGSALVAGDIVGDSHELELRYNLANTRWELLNPAISTATTPVASGGTGATTLTDGGVLLGSGTGAITPMGVLADSEMIVGDGTTDPVAESGATLRASIGVAIGSDVQAYDADTAKTDVVQDWTAAQQAGVTALTSTSNSMAISIQTTNDYSHTFTEDTTLVNPSDTAVAGQSGSIYLTQHASAPKTLAFGSEYDFADGVAPTVTATNSARDRLDYVVRADGQIEITALLNLS